MSTSASARRQGLMEAMGREGRRLGFHSTMHNHACAARLGLHPTDWEVLDVLGWSSTVTAGGLARHLGLSNGAITGAVDRLEAAGYVRRERDPADRRKVIVVPVADREADITAAFTELNQAMVAANARFSNDDLELILTFMQGASHALEESTHRLRSTPRRP